MCTGRVDLAFVLRAFLKGADGVIIGGCWPGECHYVTEGNYDALGNMLLLKKIFSHIGLDPDRLRLEWISAAEGMRFAEVMSDFSEKLGQLGPLGSGEGRDPEGLKARLQAVSELVPYIKLVERERLRIPARTEEAYRRFYESPEAERLFAELIGSRIDETPETTRPAPDNPAVRAILDDNQGDPERLIQVLMAIQEELGWLPQAVLEQVSQRLGVPLSKVLQTATFYKTFSLKPKGRHVIQVCRGSSCSVHGSQKILDALSEATGLEPGQTDRGEKFSLDTCTCLGHCNRGPGIYIDGRHLGRMTPERAKEALKDCN